MSENGSTFLSNKNLKLILFGGKGGTGKTTSAAASAIHLAQINKDKRILLVSTDPAHSLGDSFDFRVGNQITPIKDAPGLSALEIDASELLEDFKEKHGHAIKRLAGRGTYFDQQDIADFFNLSLPGLDELMAIIKVADILKSNDYDLIILDTAPTGHTIRLLELPDQMLKWIDVLDLMQHKHRYMSKRFTGGYVKDDADEFLEKMSEDVKRVRALLRNSETTEFAPVTIPEPLSINETERLLFILKNHRIPVKSIIVNRIIGGEGCDLCASRRRDQQRHIKEIEEKFKEYNLFKIPLFPKQIRGIDDLKVFASALFDETSQYQSTAVVPPSTWISTQDRPVDSNSKLSDIFNKNLQFILFGGKGGVGKTSMASATALYIAKQNPKKKVLVFSTDPAHSLSDSFGCLIGSKITAIKAQDNLSGLEIDATELVEDFKDEYRQEIDEVFDNFLGDKADMKFDREVMTELVSLSPPGLDELMALKKIMEFSEDEKYDLFVLDTSPTGHLLRFLELPSLLLDWLRAIFKLLLKYKEVVELSRTAQKLLSLSKSIKRIQKTLTDPEKTEFVAITIPEAMGIAETERLLSTLKRLEITCRHVAINMLIPPTRCGFCARKREEQKNYVQEAKRKFSDYLVSEIPLFTHDITGIDSLTELSEVMYEKESAGSRFGMAKGVGILKSVLQSIRLF
ncbi:MAG: ArsA family ATPase [candidate division Zixibacteria bacterium]|nr:ArsA family ATPase [candidate division Zixibacteria bacterium]